MNKPIRQRAPSRLALLPGLLGLGALLFAAVGCDDSATQDPQTLCESSADCVDENGELLNQVCNLDSNTCLACTSDAECQADPLYGSTSTCVEGACVACLDGDFGCACLADETCNQGNCIGGTCVDCDAGDLDCVCRANGTCTAGNVCDDGTGLCAACEGELAGALGCPCSDDPTVCGDGLVCNAVGTCEADDCVDGALDCACNADETCNTSDTYCSPDDSLCRLCTSDVDGCPCDPGDVCADGFYCDTTDTTCVTCAETLKEETCACDPAGMDQCGDDANGNPMVCDPDQASPTYSTCRAALTCTDLGCGNFACTSPVQGDPVCCGPDSDPADCPEVCLDGYALNDTVDPPTCDPVETGEGCLDADGNPTPTRIQCEIAAQKCVDNVDGEGECLDTCESLDCAGEFKSCDPGATESDAASCDGCLPGYAVDATDATLCVRDAAANCSTVPNTPGSIYDACRTRNQVCDDSDGNGAICGACLSGYVVNPLTELCEEVETCGTDICGDGEYCYYPQSGEPPSCQAERCGAGQAWDEGSASCLTCDLSACDEGDTIYPDAINGACACSNDVFCEYEDTDTAATRCFVNPCEDGEAHSLGDTMTCSSCGSLTCGDDPGERNRVWPVRDRSGLCLCETQQGYYFPSGGASDAQRCDADGDGWITASANTTWVDASTPLAGNVDEGRLANFRCDRRVIEQIELNNEYGQTRIVGLCADGQIHDWAPGDPPASCDGATNLTDIALYEPVLLDSDSGLASDASDLGPWPVYGGRQLRASEVNPMTKACVSLNADYNGNGVQDISEAQPRIKADYTQDFGDSTDEGFLYASLAYFTELHTGYYKPGASTVDAGTYVITERNRCDLSEFPLTTEVGGNSYWQACLRLRPLGYDYTAGPQVGMDFGRFSCDSQTDYCEPLPDPDFLTTGSNLDSWSGSLDAIEDHDLCSLQAAAAPNDLDMPDEPWLGMSHHSQFKCAHISDSGADYAVAPSTLQGSGTTSVQWDFNSCQIGSTTTVTDQPSVPQFDCDYVSADTFSNDPVGFVSARYAHYGLNTYIRGCIGESLLTHENATFFENSQGYKSLCPGFDENPQAVMAASNPGDYGRLICTCAEQYGGANCEVSCPVRTFDCGCTAGDTACEQFCAGLSAGLHTGGPPTYVGQTDLISIDDFDELACAEVKQGESVYCLTYPPVPSEGFLGGRRGYWMCGEFTSTRPADPTNPLPYFEGTYTDAGGNTLDVQLDGNIRMIPVQREELSANLKFCDDGTAIDPAGTCSDGSVGVIRAVSLF